MHSDSDKYTVRLWGHILLRGGIFAHLCGQIWLKLIDIHERTSMLAVKQVKIVYDTIHCEVFKQLGVNSRLCGGKSWERVNAATLRLWGGARRIKSTHTKIGLRCWLWVLCRVEDVAWQRLKPRSRFQPEELQILISAEQEAKTRFTAHRMRVGLVTNLIIRVWGYKIIIIMSTVFLHVTAIKNKLQLISSRASCWWELYKFLIHSCMCINLISHVPQKEQIIRCAHAWTCARARHAPPQLVSKGNCSAWS